jgi:protein tyrosine/serine phosphatase
MIHKFIKVQDGLYRGSAPTPKDVQILKDKYGINKIVSLDQAAADVISNTCKLLGINQVIVPLDETKQSLINFLSYNLKDLLTKGGPTFIHCKHGKDRTGLAIALYECKYKGKDPEEAIKEAKKLGFGIGVDPRFINLYEKLIRSCKPVTDNNSADIVSNEREYKGDSRDSYLDEANRSSFESYLGKNRQYPYDAVYNSINDQSPTRENYQDKPIKEYPLENDIIPQVGIYDNDAGGRGFGPTENFSGFIYD